MQKSVEVYIITIIKMKLTETPFIKKKMSYSYKNLIFIRFVCVTVKYY